MSIEAVVFDLGNVLVGWDPAGVWADELSAEQVGELLVALDFARVNRSLDAGTPWAQARPAVAAAAPDHVHHMDTYLREFPRSLTGPIEGSAEVVRDLRDAGVRVLGLTNWSAETFHHATGAAPVIGELERVIVSGQVGLAKPDPAIFRLLVSECRLDPARTVFTDDSPVNVAAAEAVGLQAVLFTDAPTLRADLARLGVALPARG